METRTWGLQVQGPEFTANRTLSKPHVVLTPKAVLGSDCVELQ